MWNDWRGNQFYYRWLHSQEWIKHKNSLSIILWKERGHVIRVWGHTATCSNVFNLSLTLKATMIHFNLRDTSVWKKLLVIFIFRNYFSKLFVFSWLSNLWLLKSTDFGIVADLLNICMRISMQIPIVPFNLHCFCVN